MLTCQSVREALPGIESGETAPGALRDHLATCAACRTEAARVRADLESLRRDLAVLAPSPFLEDRVLELARGAADASNAPTERSPSVRWGVAAALAAALLLVGVLMLPRSDENVPAGDGDVFGTDPGGPSLLQMPPTAGDVAEARRARGQDGAVVDRLHTLVGAPPADVALLGREVLARIQTPGADTEKERVARAYARLSKDGREPYLTLTVAAPGGATALVRALVTDMFSGSVLLEEPLGRALGLHEQEVRGRSTVAGDGQTHAHRTRARIVLPDGLFDGTVDVLVRLPGDPHPAEPVLVGGVPPKPALRFEGERPAAGHLGESVGVHFMHGTWFVSADRTLSFQGGAPGVPSLDLDVLRPRQAAVDYHAGAYPACLVFLPVVTFGGGGPLAWTMTMRRVVLSERFEPGAALTIARVWKGRTAIPSRESVAFTQADAQGVVSFVRTGSEAGPLRAREVRKDGSVHWHRIEVRTRPTLEVRVHTDGRIVIHEHVVTPWLMGSSRDRFEADPKALDAIRARLAWHAERARRAANGISRLEVTVVADRDAPWRIVTWVLVACATPRVRVAAFRLKLPAAPDAVVYELPVDPGLRPADEAGVQMALVLSRRGTQTVWMGFDRSLRDIPLVSDDDWEELRTVAKQVHRRILAGRRKLQMVLKVPDGDVPYGDVRRVLAILREAGIEHVGLAP